MRINKFIALATGLSRRAADKLADSGEVLINGRPIRLGQEVTKSDTITHHGHKLRLEKTQTIMLNKPVGYICSRNGQGGKTIYDILPTKFSSLKPVGRLDKDSSGLLLLTNDGQLAQQLTHPKYKKQKVYDAELDKPLTDKDKTSVEQGIKVEDYISKLQLNGHGKNWTITMFQGKNRQIRRTFEQLGYQVTSLHRTHFGPYSLNGLESGQVRAV